MIERIGSNGEKSDGSTGGTAADCREDADRRAVASVFGVAPARDTVDTAPIRPDAVRTMVMWRTEPSADTVVVGGTRPSSSNADEAPGDPGTGLDDVCDAVKTVGAPATAIGPSLEVDEDDGRSPTIPTPLPPVVLATIALAATTAASSVRVEAGLNGEYLATRPLGVAAARALVDLRLVLI
ncbi:hypothetical protein TUM20983_03690 [Mycobacterium antarcticum]|uniref:hypothetical protein n=1 Tax=unclassified Mycolicibacterium TaxID=2636767 RepID=UPI002397F523|nr:MULTISPECIES: hypothetical protein [unclassified Mycolicibacterium]GLP73259.1 hypothetical protein TUM20983_03690 [Mycolicibacterium sp. TUM20983]